MKRREFALGATALTLPGLWLQNAHAQSASSYLTLEKPVPTDAPKGKIEVLEFFSYGCSHCMTFEPIFTAWKKAAPADVSVHLVHVGFSSNFEPLQRIFYSLEAIGEVDKLHAKVFEAFQKKRIRLDKPDVLFGWVAEQGADRAKFEQAYKSFGVSSRIRRAVELQEAYKVEATPSVGIAGRYYSDPGKAQGFEQLIRVTNELIERERKSLAG